VSQGLFTRGQRVNACHVNLDLCEIVQSICKKNNRGQTSTHM